MDAGDPTQTYVPPRALRDMLVGDLYWSGAALADPGRGLARAARWHAALVGQGLDELPFAVVFDLGHLLLQGPALPLGVAGEIGAVSGDLSDELWEVANAPIGEPLPIAEESFTVGPSPGEALEQDGEAQ